MTKKKPLELHRCKGCGVSFRTSREFEAHACVKELENLSMDELMRRYEQERAPQKMTGSKSASADRGDESAA